MNLVGKRKLTGVPGRGFLDIEALKTRAARRIVAVGARFEHWGQKFKRVLHGYVSNRCEPIPVRVARSGGPMKDKDKLVALIRLRDMLYFGVRPTLRQCGFPPETVQELANEGLIQLGDRKFGDDPDRYAIEEILPAGLAFILQQHALRDRLDR